MRALSADSRLLWIALVASFSIGLAAVARMAGPGAADPDSLSGVIRLPERVTWTIVTLFGLAALVFFAHVVRRGLSRRRAEDEEFERAAEGPPLPPWVRAAARIVPLLYFAAVAYLVWRGAIPLVDLASLGLGAGTGIGPDEAGPASISAPPLITWTFGIVALATGLGALALALWIAFSDRLARWWDDSASDAWPAPFEVAVDDSLDDLRTEPDARRAIIRCYSRFERVAANSGIGRKPWSTPMEFMREMLDRLPPARAAVPTLTGLFELARFSQRTLGATERDRALDALDEIKAALGVGREDAPAR